MKKFMKAIAFVTVMCMALSTVAFAVDDAVLDATVDKQVNVTVADAVEGEQVALYIVEKGAALSVAPLYIDQKPVVEGEAYFEAYIANETVKEVDVYVGYKSYADLKQGPLKVKTVSLERPITTINVTKIGTDVVISNAGQTKAEDQYGAGVAATFVVSAPKDRYVTDMIWAIRYDNDGTPDIKYTARQNITDYNIGGIIENGSSVKLGLAFLNGSVLGNIDPVTITGVDAIFLFDNEEYKATSTDLEADHDTTK